MQIKLFEVRDRGTTMPVMAIKPGLSIFTHGGVTDLMEHLSISDKELWLWRLAGYSMETDDPIIILIALAIPSIQFDVYAYPKGSSRTMPVAHDYIKKKWQTLKSGDLIDIEYILKETLEPKTSEMLETLGA